MVVLTASPQDAGTSGIDGGYSEPDGNHRRVRNFYRWEREKKKTSCCLFLPVSRGAESGVFPCSDCSGRCGGNADTVLSRQLCV